MEEHHLTVTRAARYFTRGSPGDHVREVWFVCHGYSQLAASFLALFSTVDAEHRLIVAPEALSRFYTSHEPRAVGASWMTREDRLTEIADYITFLDAVYSQVVGPLDRSEIGVHVLGFSQGVATAARWVAQGNVQADRLILWGGPVPPDLDLKGDGRRLAALELVLVLGKDDEFATQEQLAEEEARLKAHGIPYRLIRFDGGHRLDREVLSALAADADERQV